jgi:hypothetical protein
MTEQEPIWRAVAYIGTHRGDRGGESWRLVLDPCGHVEWRKIPPQSLNAMARGKMRAAPERVRCASCEVGIAPFDLGGAVALGQRVDEAPSP